VLSDVLPLSTPFVLQVFPIYACNFKCKYCIFSIPASERHFISDKVSMSMDLYKKCINDMATFPDRVKVLRFVGIGEPLLHRNIANMIAYASSHDVARTLELLTNASLLSPKMSDSLIAAGLSRLVISLQGTTQSKYRDVCGFNIDFQTLIENIRYFYTNKSNTKVYIKIIDCAFDGNDDEQRFYDIFGNICDTMAVEHAVPIHAGVKFDGVLKTLPNEVTQFGLPVSDVHICPQPFFTLQINPDGKVVPCYSFEYPAIMGDCNHESVPAIWNGPAFQRFRHAMLGGMKADHPICSECNIIKYRLFQEDVLDKDVDRLKVFYEN